MGSLNMCIVLFLVMLPSMVASKEQLSSRECENLGFTGLALCSDCNTFSEYVKDQELVSDCLKCCTEDSDDSMSKITYSGAILEVCMRKLVFYPEVVSFIEEEKDKFPTVKVQYIYNSPPKLIMLDDEGQHKETIRIDNWKREHMLQFLQEKVKPKFQMLKSFIAVGDDSSRTFSYQPSSGVEKTLWVSGNGQRCQFELDDTPDCQVQDVVTCRQG